MSSASTLESRYSAGLSKSVGLGVDNPKVCFQTFFGLKDGLAELAGVGASGFVAQCITLLVLTRVPIQSRVHADRD